MVHAVRGTVREELTAAAITLFQANGYDKTTVDEIAEAAGVARRTFFRHFRSKEDAVFPDHDDCLRRVEEHLNAADARQPPFQLMAGAAHLVLAMYAEDPPLAVRRYQLIREVEPLREREITTTTRYQRVFSEYLHRHQRGPDHHRLLHEVAAATVVATHNYVLRQWLRDGGTGDPHARLDDALRTVSEVYPGWLRAESGTPAGDEVLVLRVRPDTPLWRIAEEIEAATSERGAPSPDAPPASRGTPGNGAPRS
jgi:AcrR family transcriptional regulator